MLNGYIHSIQSLGAVDGPGLRSVVFMQGCPLRCAYCHNPDTWDMTNGTQIAVGELVDKLLRFKPYFKRGGGVTVSGGEPLMQSDFVAELFCRLHEEGVHTALDTSCAGSTAKAKKVLAHTDLVLADVKFLTEEAYFKHCKGSFQTTKAFLDLTESLSIPLWVRHVVVPGLTDELSHMRKMQDFCHTYSNLKKIEWLPFQKLCIEKYQRMHVPFPLESTPAMASDALEARLLAL